MGHSTIRLGGLISLTLLWVGSACGGIIEIVPITTPTPTSTPVSRVSTEPTPRVPAATSIPTRIAAEVIDLDSPVTEMGWRVKKRWGQFVSEWEMPDDEAAWHRNSARPGEGSNIVISGHNASRGGQVFADLEELQIGDEITLWNELGESFVYQVMEKNIIRTFASSQEAQNYLKTVVAATAQEQLTLITCWPRWTNTHRLIVIAEPK